MARYIAIEEPIAAGKTTLVRSFQDKLAAQIILDVFDNPLLTKGRLNCYDWLIQEPDF